MDVLHQTFDKCAVRAKYESASDKSPKDEAEGDGFGNELPERGVGEAKAGEGEEKRLA